MNAINSSNLPVARPVSIISAAAEVDTGDIWHKTTIHIPPDALYSEINQLIFNAEFFLIEQALSMIDLKLLPAPQDTRQPTFYRRRKPSDSEVNPENSINSIFNLLRVADPERYPVYFYRDGVKFILTLHKENG